MERLGRNATDENKCRYGVTGSGTGAGTVLVAVLLVVAGGSAAAGQPLFPEPFVVEHQIVQTDPDGTGYPLEPVTDYYDGSRIISVRPDDSRLVVDFRERQIIRIDPEHQTFAVLSFDRYAELNERLRFLDLGYYGPPPEEEEGVPKAVDREAQEEPQFRFEELPVAAGDAKAAGGELLVRPGVRRLRVTLEEKSGGDEGSAVEVWVDPGIRLGPAALTALERFQDEVLGAPDEEDGVALPRYLAAARKHAGGAFPIRTLRPSATGGESSEVGTIEDRALRLEPIATIPEELLTVPEGYRRVPHPLEHLAVYANEEAQLRDRTSGPEQEF